jgi:C1A family cysteine protease
MQGGVCTVASDADSGANTLRALLEDPTCETIYFANDYTIVLASQLLIYRSVTVDGAGLARAAVLERLKASLAAGHPAMFGFTVYSSVDQAEATGRIPVPFGRERIEGGHAVVALGYDDALEIANASGGEPARGALLVRNSWGRSWGEKGYGWLPYAYVLRGLAEDFWSVLKKDWIDTGEFKI